MNSEKMREEFEAAFSQPPYEFDLSIHDYEGAWPNNYTSYHVQCAWEGYQAACASKQKEIDKYTALLEEWHFKAVERSKKIDELEAKLREQRGFCAVRWNDGFGVLPTPTLQRRRK